MIMSEKKTLDANQVRQLLQHNKNEIQRLQTLVQQLQTDIDNITPERDQAVSESKLAIEDAALARSFSKKNYTSLLLELFEAPSKRLRKQTYLIFSIAAAVILALIFSHLYTNHSVEKNHQLSEERLTHLNNNIELLLLKQEVNSIKAEINSPPRAEDKKSQAETHIQKNDNLEPANKKITRPQQAAKGIKIKEQATLLLDFIRTAEKQIGFPKNYQRDKTSFAQLYLIVMQHASNDNLYYESYLEAINSLAITKGVAPTSVDDLVQMDFDFLHASYSAYTITAKKLNESWRYRATDKQFSSYYNNTLNYNLGAWQIVNENNDYKQLPTIFSLNMQRTMQQLAFNEKLSTIKLPKTIYYSAYKENSKNTAVATLFNNQSVNNNNGVLAIDASATDIKITSKMVYALQEKLEDGGFLPKSTSNGIFGKQTKAAIKAFRKDSGLEENSRLDVVLLNHLGLSIGYSDLLLD
ncbi:MAG: hypothetical protein ACI9NY_000242 [Kiritimatiellia bacterium]|jgi:hypothetical protein